MYKKNLRIDRQHHPIYCIDLLLHRTQHKPSTQYPIQKPFQYSNKVKVVVSQVDVNCWCTHEDAQGQDLDSGNKKKRN